MVSAGAVGLHQHGLAAAGSQALMYLEVVAPVGLKTARSVPYRCSNVSNVWRPSLSLTELRNELPGSMCEWTQPLPTLMPATVATLELGLSCVALGL